MVEVSKREKQVGVDPDPDIDTYYMKVPSVSLIFSFHYVSGVVNTVQEEQNLQILECCPMRNTGCASLKAFVCYLSNTKIVLTYFLFFLWHDDG